MKLTTQRIDSMIDRDPVAVTYIGRRGTVTINGLRHRAQMQRSPKQFESDQPVGMADREPDMAVLIRAPDSLDGPPNEGETITIASETFRVATVQTASDATHLIVLYRPLTS